jgi:hypothetical protein
MTPVDIMMAYAKCINRIDDYLEYMYKANTPDEMKKVIMSYIDAANSEIKELQERESK